MKQSKKICIYCGSATSITADHIPPKCLFSERDGLRLITVPACHQCNNSYAKDDEYFRIRVCIDASRNQQGDKLWEKKLKPSFCRRPRLRQSIISRISNVSANVRKANGEIARGKIITFPKPRVDTVLMRIVRGLYWHHYNERLAVDTLFEIFQYPEMPSEIKKILLKTNFRAVGREEFKYRYRRSDNNKFTSVWWLSFFMGSHFLVFTNPRNMNPPSPYPSPQNGGGNTLDDATLSKS